MKCPVDGATLMMTERSGVEIDYCPQCRGVWLDRGELEMLLALAFRTGKQRAGQIAGQAGGQAGGAPLGLPAFLVDA